MISQRARECLDTLFRQAIQDGLFEKNDPPREMLAINRPTEICESMMVMLTISSYLFRLFFLIHFTPDAKANAFFAKQGTAPPEGTSERSVLDALAERGNVSCGALNRELARFFPHTGMSTPNFIDRNYIDHLQFLGCSHARHYRLVTGDGFTFHTSYGICEYADLDMAAEPIQAEVVTGELELF